MAQQDSNKIAQEMIRFTGPDASKLGHPALSGVEFEPTPHLGDARYRSPNGAMIDGDAVQSAEGFQLVHTPTGTYRTGRHLRTVE